MDKQQIIDYIMHTPSNTNPAMLGQFLDEYSGGSGESWSTFFEDEITTEEQNSMYVTQLSISDYIDTDKIKVTFDGVEYVCNKTATETGNIYGGSFNEEYGFDFSNCPFVIASMYIPKSAVVNNHIATESPGTYSIKIEVPQESGSSGDWSTAEVTFINQSNRAIVEIPNIVQVPEEAAEIYPTNTLLAARGTLSDTETTLIVPLYKGYCVFQDTASFTVSGNATQMGPMAIITGDCTITVGGEGGNK